MSLGPASPSDPEDQPPEQRPSDPDGAQEASDPPADAAHREDEASLPDHEFLRLGLPRDPDEAPEETEKDHPHAIGEVIGDHYEIVEVIGKGGMGRVYKALDRDLDRFVAIKRPLFVSERFLVGFEKEAKIAANLKHGNICRVLGSFVDELGPGLVMEYCSGGNLQQLVQREGPVEVDRALDLALGILGGLRSMHENQVEVIHRDVKPANILLDDEGEPKLTDFGLAKRDGLPGMSRDGCGQGTPGYWAPEQQCDAKSADACSDIYSFGMTLHFLLTGSLPSQDPVRDLPPIFVQFFKRCTRMSPKDRFQSAKEALEDLWSCEALVRTPRGLAKPQIPGAARDTCPDCGERNVENRRYCWNCECALIEACPNCHTDNRHWERVCGNCGVDCEVWKNMLAHVERALEHARGDVDGVSYEEALAELEEARRLSRGRAEFEVLAEQTLDRIEFLRTTRDELEELWAAERYEEAVPLLEALLEAWPQDHVARTGLDEVPGLIHRRELRVTTGALRRAVAVRNLASARRLLRDVRELSGDDQDTELLDVQRLVERLEAQLTRETLLRLEAALSHERWDVARGVLARLAEIGVDAQVQRDSRLRILVSMALAHGELRRARRLLAGCPTGAESSPWAADLRARLRDLENERLDLVRGTILGVRKSSSLARARRKLAELSEELGVERSEQVLELEHLLRRRRRGSSLRELGVALGVLLMLGGVAGGLLLNRAMDVRERAYLGLVLEWAIGGKRGACPAREADEWRERLPAWLVDLWERPAIGGALEILKRPGALAERGWSERVALLSALPPGGELAEARNNLLAWHRDDLRARFAACEQEQLRVITSAAPYLSLAEVGLEGLPGVWVEGLPEMFELQPQGIDLRGLDGRHGSVSLHPPDLAKPDSPDKGIACNLRLVVDVTPPVGELALEELLRDREAGRVELILGLVAEEEPETTSVEYRRVEASEEWQRVPPDADGRCRLELEAPEPFGRTSLAWRLVDEYGNSREVLPAGFGPALLSSVEQAILDSMASRDWGRVDALLFSAAALEALGDPRRGALVEQLRAELRAELIGGEPGPSVAIELRTSAVESGDAPGGSGWDWRPLAPGRTWLRQLPLDLRVTVFPPREECLVEYEGDGGWVSWRGVRGVDGCLSLGPGSGIPLEANGAALELRIGGYEVLRDQWFELEVIHDDRRPEFAGRLELVEEETGDVVSRIDPLRPQSFRVQPGKRYALVGGVDNGGQVVSASLFRPDAEDSSVQVEQGAFQFDVSFAGGSAPVSAVLQLEDPGGLISTLELSFDSSVVPFDLIAVTLFEGETSLASWSRETDAARVIGGAEDVEELPIPWKIGQFEGAANFRLALEFSRTPGEVRLRSPAKMSTAPAGREVTISWQASELNAADLLAYVVSFEAEPLEGEKNMRRVRLTFKPN